MNNTDKIAEALKILEMIEGLDPEDKADCIETEYAVNRLSDNPYSPPLKVCRSIDSQKPLEREGWCLNVNSTGQISGKGFLARAYYGVHHALRTPNLPTEPLARLHAWIQVWIYEWENG